MAMVNAGCPWDPPEPPSTVPLELGERHGIDDIAKMASDHRGDMDRM